MPLTWPEIRQNALEFQREWASATSEEAESQTFWNQFFDVFGLNRRRVATFQFHVKRLGERKGKIDLFWPGLLLVEHKSAGESLDAACVQAAEYFDGLPDTDIPGWVIVSDYRRLRLIELGTGKALEIGLGQFAEHVERFAFLLGQSRREFADSPPVNLRAVRLMADLHDRLSDNGYSGHALERLLVRLMFCLFADHTQIFDQRGDFAALVEEHTRDDGSDCGAALNHLFAVLDQPEHERQRSLAAHLRTFPYVNGELFRERFDPPAFDAASRRLLIECARFDWSRVSPAVFGSLFQCVMDPAKRRQIGAHYTSEKNILKVIGGLFLDDLRTDLGRARTPASLRKLAGRIREMHLFDPACGCGNFLVVAYRELRTLELEVQKRIAELDHRRNGQGALLAAEFSGGLNVDSMHGIEIEEFPARIAETALYLVDHQINRIASAALGKDVSRLPLKKAPGIVHGNALALDWNKVAPKSRITHVLGNPPFVGKKARTDAQASDMLRVFRGMRGHGELDYVACWYRKAADYIRKSKIRVAYVSTNSICQGEQAAILWDPLLSEGFRIDFAHRTFRWNNEAPGEAHVHCVIVGFHHGAHLSRTLPLYDYPDPCGEPVRHAALNINPYLVDGRSRVAASRRDPLRDVPRCAFGSMPNDGGNLLLTDDERRALVAEHPEAGQLIRPFLSAKEFLHGIPRWCLWLCDVPAAKWRQVEPVRRRVDAVIAHRSASAREATRRLVDVPYSFGEIRQPTRRYILIPRHSSEQRKYVPMDVRGPADIAADSCLVVETEDLYYFGVLSSAMHMMWMRYVCGRIKSDFRYSAEVVYNNYPWPWRPKASAMQAVRSAAQTVLDARAAFPGVSLSDLYDRTAMPRPLSDAHAALDRAVDSCYGVRGFKTDLSRATFLFDEFARQVAELSPPELPSKPPAGSDSET